MPYRKPQIFSSIKECVKKLAELKITSLLLVTDSFLRKSGVTASLENLLKEKGIACYVYDGTQPNPTVQNVEEATVLYGANNCQALSAFGGGSSMDCAKATGACVVYPKKTLAQMRGLLRVLRKLPPLVAIPTTAGTGSEVTVTAVITDLVEKHKYTMNNFSAIPSYAVLDASVTYSLPKQLTATTGMDALALSFILGKSVSGTKLGPKVVATIYLAQIVLSPSQYFFLNMLPIPESIVILP